VSDATDVPVSDAIASASPKPTKNDDASMLPDASQSEDASQMHATQTDAYKMLEQSQYDANLMPDANQRADARPEEGACQHDDASLMPDASHVPVPPNTTRSSTIPDAVARYTIVPIYNLNGQILTPQNILAIETSQPSVSDDDQMLSIMMPGASVMRDDIVMTVASVMPNASVMPDASMMPDTNTVPVPPNITRSSTIPDAVARYKKVPYKYHLNQILTKKIPLVNVMPANKCETSKDVVKSSQPSAAPCTVPCETSKDAVKPSQLSAAPCETSKDVAKPSQPCAAPCTVPC
jgi:hypothetical protein